MYIKRVFSFFIPVILLVLLLPITAEAASSSKAGQVAISSGWLNVRGAPDAASVRVSSLQKGSYVTLVSRSGQWWKVEYSKGKFGYCHSSYIREIPADAYSVSIGSGYLNVRSGPGTGYSRAGVLYKGESVLVLSSSGGWSRVLFHGTKTGYVSSRYLSGGYQAVSVEVPDFKQMDPRWADKIIGTSGKTFAQIGCATTAISMMESNRKGQNILPDAMAKELRYTPSGNVYWPSHYRVVSSQEGYLETIYQLLTAQKPVLLGMRNSAGQQHWVVVTGYTGGNSLSAAGFTIRDPGSSYRTNLQQFLDRYPYFYKFFYF